MQVGPMRGQIAIVPGTPAQVVMTLASRLPLVRQAVVQEQTIPGEGSDAGSQALVLRYQLLVPTLVGIRRSEALWQGDLLTGAVADEYAVRGFGKIGGAFASLITPTGETADYGGAVGNVVRNQVFLDVPADIAAAVTRRAALFGLHHVHVSQVTALQTAIAIKATTGNPKRDVAHLMQRHGLSALLQRAPGSYEGAFLEIDDASGAARYVVGYAGRNGAKLYWLDPSLGI